MFNHFLEYSTEAVILCFVKKLCGARRQLAIAAKGYAAHFSDSRTPRVCAGKSGAPGLAVIVED
jgi:hypothetical protein